MILDSHTKHQIRTALLLELNNCFTKVSKDYEKASELERDFLQNLITSLKGCIAGNEPPPPIAE